MTSNLLPRALVAGLLAVGLVSAAHAADPIRVGFLTIKSGALAAGGKQMEDGLRLFLKERNNMIAGRKVELVVGDTGGQPAITKTKTQELVEKDKVQVIIGPLAAFEALAIDDYVRKNEIPVISPSAAAEDLTQRKANPWFVRAVGTSAQPSHAMGEYAAKEMKFKRVAIIADDFAFGHEIAAGFQRTFEENGGKVVQKLWSPLNVADYGTYIGQIKPDVDAVFAAFAGGNGIKFLKQYSEYGLKGKIPVISAMTTVDEGILKSMGDEALGVVSTGWYAASLGNPDNKKFVAAMNRDYQQDPGYYSMGAYGAALMLEQALKDVNGKIEDKPAFMAALRKVQLVHDPRGKVSLDALGNPVMDIYVRKVERVGGKLTNSVIKTYPAVSQFWTYNKKDFLANPVYSRDYPPALNLEK
ncbi:MAG: ABC transporter substrate-binding protein [Polaromonas sp. 39-63-203]|jgi:branched-chain amino acid transport system substrate-binding protein|uniref:ABC transporter substrate-binding protein n=1 Tax=Polaromonas sp. TaxID=1869339 RepID=UPI000BD933A7|nr:ABC transporter substrate-binding protein [Polaromonas sp.]OYY52903.1 MAG: ABC transporter substrate-binding protein [Polaromonas sp. 35-63-240]OYZ02829.1 MAG: ABC transporter substrate-binding protein [Polaromonas sp. 28-63-22]OYZ84179.1 MAG: ABC transporter substrate-binding protein [Polaromonas sp. 24-62-144]OZA97233.1 MAG: ABC transporter substrate-binding protein [Polaromonas sp. 39-63-203]HQS32251.1 ABC transporter substrate-binding protein [Polaromonas sp.]